MFCCHWFVLFQSLTNFSVILEMVCSCPLENENLANSTWILLIVTFDTPNLLKKSKRCLLRDHKKFQSVLWQKEAHFLHACNNLFTRSKRRTRKMEKKFLFPTPIHHGHLFHQQALYSMIWILLHSQTYETRTSHPDLFACLREHETSTTVLIQNQLLYGPHYSPLVFSKKREVMLLLRHNILWSMKQIQLPLRNTSSSTITFLVQATIELETVI